jgi:hypothetical protein
MSEPTPPSTQLSGPTFVAYVDESGDEGFSFEKGSSECCRDHRTARDQGDGRCQVFLSNRSGMSYDELRGYFSHLKANTGLFDIRIDWSVVDTALVSARSAGRLMGLQIADAVASSFFYAFEDSRLGFTEDRYARMLKPVIYRHQGSSAGYGVKIWPRETDAEVRTHERFTWLRDFDK